MIKFNGTEISVYPKVFKVTYNDLDSDNSVRTSNGKLNRSRIAVKTQIEMEWGRMSAAEMSSILSGISGVFFPVYYPDPQTGTYLTKTFYASNRPVEISNIKSDIIAWKGLSVTLIEQ